MHTIAHIRSPLLTLAPMAKNSVSHLLTKMHWHWRGQMISGEVLFPNLSWLNLAHSGSKFYCPSLCAIWLLLAHTSSHRLTLAHTEQKFCQKFARRNVVVLIVGVLLGLFQLSTSVILEEQIPFWGFFG